MVTRMVLILNSKLSLRILRILYLATAYAPSLNDELGKKLTPQLESDRKQMESWISMELNRIRPELREIIRQRIFLPRSGAQTGADEAIVKKRATAAKMYLQIMDVHLGDNEYLAGTQFSLADVVFMPYCLLLSSTPEKDLLESKKNITAWWKRVSKRESWKTLAFKANEVEGEEKIDEMMLKLL